MKAEDFHGESGKLLAMNFIYLANFYSHVDFSSSGQQSIWQPACA
jgi:hypothetical protein